MKLLAYEAILSQPQSLAQVRQARRFIEAVGGRVHLAPPTKAGMVLVTLLLPEGYSPQHYLPTLPFYPV